MAFWIFMLLMDLLVPLTMLVFGSRFVKKPPKKINPTFGYRTTMSMQNSDTWDFAHRYCGKLWFRCGLVLLPVSVVPLAFVLNREVATVGIVGAIVCAVQLVPLVVTMVCTEAALKRTFDENGIRR